MLRTSCQYNLNLETEGKINLQVTFTHSFVTQSKLSLIFTKTQLFSHKTAYFLTDSLGSYYKTADGNSKFHITKLIPSKILTLKKHQ